MAKDKQAPTAPAAAPASSTKPGDPGSEKAKKEKVSKVRFAVPEEGLDAWPADFDPKKHKPLRRSDFKNELPYLEHRREKLQSQLTSVEEEIKLVKETGSSGGRAKAKKLLKVQNELDTLKDALAAQGINAEELLAKMKEVAGESK